MSDTSQGAVDLAVKPVLTISGHENSVYGLAYLSGGGRLVTSSGDQTVRVWDSANGEEEGISMEYDGWVQGLAVTRDGKRILGGGQDKVLHVWDVVVSPNNQLVASGDREGRIVIRETEDGEIKHSIETVPGDVNSICFSPDGTKLASGHDDTKIRVFDVGKGELILGPIEGHTGYVHSVIWSRDGRRLFTGSWDATIQCWDSDTGEAIGNPWTGHTASVNSLSLSPDGTKLASASTDNTVRFWAADPVSGDPIGDPLQHEKSVWVVLFSPSGEFVACGGADRKVSIWRAPWWDDSGDVAHKLLLDLPAVTNHTENDLNHQLDYLDLPTNYRPSPSRTHLGTPHATEDPSRTHGSAFSWRLWRTLPRLLFGRSHAQPRHGEVTTIYPGFATQRIYVASRDGESTIETITEPMPTAPGHYGTFSIFVESVSSIDSLDESQPTPAPPVNSGDVQISCCALLSRRRARSGNTPPHPTVEPTRRVSPSSSAAPPLVVPSSHPSTQNVVDLPVDIELPPGMA